VSNEQVRYYLAKVREEVLKPAKFFRNLAIVMFILAILFAVPPLGLAGGLLGTIFFLPVGVGFYLASRIEMKRSRKVIEALDRGDYLVALRILENLNVGSAVRLGPLGAHYASALGYLQQAILLMGAEATSNQHK